jgi:hypothetical protein
MFSVVPYSHVPTQRHHIEQRVVRRAWADAAYKQRLLQDPKAALEEELGVQLPAGLKVQVVEEHPDQLCIVIPVDLSGVPRPTAQVMMGSPPHA